MLASTIQKIIARGYTVTASQSQDTVSLHVIDSQGNVVPWITFTLGKSGKVNDTAVKSYPTAKPAGFDSCHEYVAVYGDEYARDAKTARKMQLERCKPVAVPVPNPFADVPVPAIA